MKDYGLLMRCMDVLRLADPFEEIPLICSACFFSPPMFSLFWHVRPQGGSFPQHRVWDRGTEGETDRVKEAKKKKKEKKSCIDHLTSTISLESITQTTLLMLNQHCLEY